NLTEFNTAHNRRISMLGISDDTDIRNTNRKRKEHCVSFNEDEEIINPEDIDPSIGRFRNLIQTTIVSTSKGLRNMGPIMSYAIIPTQIQATDSMEPKKKKYAKEACA
ncbi:hypothetical protein NQ317_008586, partial [Molorchus minor]